jgi:hypothetical protein
LPSFISSLTRVPCLPLPLPAQVEFDQLCFDFGIELDEDVSPSDLCSGRERREGRNGELTSLPSILFVRRRLQTTEEVEATKKAGLPTDEPVSTYSLIEGFSGGSQ